jgi:hypothetical protein
MYPPGEDEDAAVTLTVTYRFRGKHHTVGTPHLTRHVTTQENAIMQFYIAQSPTPPNDGNAPPQLAKYLKCQ